MAGGRSIHSRITDAEVLLEILDGLPTSIFVKNEKLQFEFSNAAHCALAGIGAEKMLGLTDAEVHASGEVEAYRTRDLAVLATGETNEAEEFVTGRDGLATPYFTRKSRLTTSGGRTYLIGTNTELASIRQREEVAELKRINGDISRLNRELADNMRQLKEAQDELVTRGKLAQLGQLIATVAHEIRNPLGAVRTASFLLERKTRGKGLGIEPQIERINSGIGRCDAIITQLLDFARSKSLQYDSLDLDDWLEKTLEEEIQKLPAAVTVQRQPGLGGALVQFDPGRLSRGIINLVSNASEALVGKGDDPAKFANASPRITIATRGHGEHVEIAVSDNGPGISAANLQRIFEPLFTTKSFGTGLGLSAVQKIAEQHGGALSVASEPGAGATFTIRIPWTQSSEEAA
jgi:signal transduction histidine kinase